MRHVRNIAFWLGVIAYIILQLGALVLPDSKWKIIFPTALHQISVNIEVMVLFLIAAVAHYISRES